ncbi:hydroxysteroid dehydrogenase-like protein 1 isoform X1 [Neocloeon triangulifer]|uniref:hydroxysteroid dehydrogenase-like protein 1 isoform X1 n=1 Tax=Neocloeon triangulifer TaxID=2078957 RepID=UPI00286F7950|nr:hydroxysteroid dehydrogenase-like protein 1 isoform X1 [Neocloeon triangulifer]
MVIIAMQQNDYQPLHPNNGKVGSLYFLSAERCRMKFLFPLEDRAPVNQARSDTMEVLFWIAFISIALIVLAVVSYFGLVITYILYHYFVCALFKQTKDLKKCYGSWAVVTGGSYGIGKYYAIELAKRNMNIMLVSRSEEKLKSVSKEIAETYGVQSKYVAVDLGSGLEATQKVAKAIEGLDIGILVNNAGTSGGLPNYFANLPRENIWNLLNLNICALTDLVHIVLPQMKSRGRGLIVNVSSVAALAPNPFSSIYAASKAYVHSFSEAIKVECQGTGVEVQTLAPGYVDTDFIQSNVHLLPGLFNPSPESFSKSAVATIGHMKWTSGYWSHELQSASLQLLPEFLRQIVMTLFVDTKTYKS